MQVMRVTALIVSFNIYPIILVCLLYSPAEALLCQNPLECYFGVIQEQELFHCDAQSVEKFQVGAQIQIM